MGVPGSALCCRVSDVIGCRVVLVSLLTMALEVIVWDADAGGEAVKVGGVVVDEEGLGELVCPWSVAHFLRDIVLGGVQSTKSGGMAAVEVEGERGVLPEPRSAFGHGDGGGIDIRRAARIAVAVSPRTRAMLIVSPAR
jgi:hypothetical protein